MSETNNNNYVYFVENDLYPTDEEVQEQIDYVLHQQGVIVVQPVFYE
jgi:hypothetical protein